MRTYNRTEKVGVSFYLKYEPRMTVGSAGEVDNGKIEYDNIMTELKKVSNVVLINDEFPDNFEVSLKVNTTTTCQNIRSLVRKTNDDAFAKFTKDVEKLIPGEVSVPYEALHQY